MYVNCYHKLLPLSFLGGDAEPPLIRQQLQGFRHFLVIHISGRFCRFDSQRGISSFLREKMVYVMASLVVKLQNERLLFIPCFRQNKHFLFCSSVKLFVDFKSVEVPPCFQTCSCGRTRTKTRVNYYVPRVCANFN